MKRLSILKDISTIMIGTIIAQVVPIILQPLLKRLFSPEEFGVFDLYFRIVILLAAIISLKYEKAIVLCKEKSDSFVVLISSISIALLITIIVEFFLIFGFKWIINWLNFPEKYKHWLFLAPLSAFFFASTLSISYFLIRQQKFWHSSSLKIYRRFTEGAIQSGLGFFKISTGLALGDFLGNISSFLSGIFKLRKEDLDWAQVNKKNVIFNLKKYSDLPKYSMLSNLLNTFVLSALTFQIFSKFTLEDVGYMELTQKILTIPTAFIGMAIGQVILQRFAKAYSSNRSILKIFLGFTLSNFIFAIGFSVIIWFWSNDIFKWLFGPSWIKSAEYAKIIIIGTGVYFIVSSLGQALIGLNKIKKNAFWECFKFIVIVSLFFIDFRNINQYLITYNYVLLSVYCIYYIVIFTEVIKYEKMIKQHNNI